MSEALKGANIENRSGRGWGSNAPQAIAWGAFDSAKRARAKKTGEGVNDGAKGRGSVRDYRLRHLGMIVFALGLIAVSVVLIDRAIRAFESDVGFVRARVVSVDEAVDYAAGVKIGVQEATIRILEGSMAGKEVRVSHRLRGDWQIDTYLEPGMTVVVALTPLGPEEVADGFSYGEIRDTDGARYAVAVVDADRTRVLGLLAAAFFGLLLLFGRRQGLMTLAALFSTAALFLYILIPLYLRGVPAIPLTFAFSVTVTFVTLFLVGGFNIKALVAAVGVTFGLAVTAFLGPLAGRAMHLTGATTGFEQLLFYAGALKVNIADLFYSGLLISALGALLDVGIEMASAQHEIARRRPDIGFVRLWESGMNIGRDVMGTMATTLLFFFFGSSTALVLLFVAQESHPLRILNFNFVASELLRAFVGSISVVLTIPLTALIGAAVFPRMVGRRVGDATRLTFKRQSILPEGLDPEGVKTEAAVESHTVNLTQEGG